MWEGRRKRETNCIKQRLAGKDSNRDWEKIKREMDCTRKKGREDRIREEMNGVM